MKLLAIATLLAGAFALPVVDVTHLKGVTKSTQEASEYRNHVLHKRVTTIAQNAGLGIGTIIGNALGKGVMDALPDVNTWNGLIDSLTALGNKATAMGFVQQAEDAETYRIESSIKHHTPPASTKSPIVQLLEQARDAPEGPWGGIGRAIGGPIGKEIGKVLETA